MSLLHSIQSLLKDPPPEFAFEISASGIAMSRTRPPATIQFAALQEGVLVPSPIRENIVDVPAFTAAVRKLVPASGGRRTAALILPDNAMRLAVLEFDSLPEKEEERIALVRFRLKKTVPFDVDAASVSYHVQAGNKVLVAVTPGEVIAQYEALFRAAGLQPGIVTPAALLLLELLPATGSYLVAHQNSGALAVLVVGNGVLTLTRSLELNSDFLDAASVANIDPLDEIVSDLYATRVYVEDQAGARPDRLYLAGFGAESSRVALRLSSELDVEVEVIREEYPGLAGYLRSLSPTRAQSKTQSEKVAA
jgi:type IV pilus assembly protein PilM